MRTGATPGASGDDAISTVSTKRLCYREPPRGETRRRRGRRPEPPSRLKATTMKKAAVVLMITVATALAGAQALTPAQALDRRGIGERRGLSFSPDGSRVVFSVAEPVKAAARPRAIWIYELASGRSRQLTFSGMNDSAPQWSPDGASIAFLSDRDGPAQIYLLPMRGGEADKLTDRKDAIRAFRWSPDG